MPTSCGADANVVSRLTTGKQRLTLISSEGGTPRSGVWPLMMSDTDIKRRIFVRMAQECYTSQRPLGQSKDSRILAAAASSQGRWHYEPKCLD
ncbi:uncharacterized protein PG986_004723 [Apiospora aurea]|uniref:Uncharacterized protein n=1 Tax=Apiospora aurea TaxID=335848 RepID=A0ABR1QNE2_9PEZI